MKELITYLLQNLVFTNEFIIMQRRHGRHFSHPLQFRFSQEIGIVFRQVDTQHQLMLTCNGNHQLRLRLVSVPSVHQFKPFDMQGSFAKHPSQHGVSVICRGNTSNFINTIVSYGISVIICYHATCNISWNLFEKGENARHSVLTNRRDNTTLLHATPHSFNFRAKCILSK